MNFETKRLQVGPMTQGAAEALTELLLDPVVGQTYMVPDFSSRQEAEALARRLVALSQTPGRYMAGIFREGTLVGILHETEVTPDWVELGSALLPRYYGQGYCTEALRGALDWLLEQGVAQVRAGAFADNRASLRVMEKAGMVPIDHRDQVEYRGILRECVYWATEVL